MNSQPPFFRRKPCSENDIQALSIQEAQNLERTVYALYKEREGGKYRYKIQEIAAMVGKSTSRIHVMIRKRGLERNRRRG